MHSDAVVHQHSILVVDDDSGMREIIIDALSADNYLFFEAPDAKEALAVVSAVNPCLALLDVAMPGMDGFALCRRLREREETARIPIALVTGRIDEDDFENGLSAGATDYIRKPFDTSELRLRVRNLIDLHETGRRYRTIFDGASQGILAYSIDDRSIKMVNRSGCFLLGYSEEDLLNMYVSQLCPPDASDVFSFPFNGDISTANRILYDVPLRKHDGTFVPVDVSTTVLFIDGQICIVAFLTDASPRKLIHEKLQKEEAQRKFYEEELNSAQKMEAVGRLAAGIAHEINTPTQFVSHNIQFLKTSFETLRGLVHRYSELLNGALSDESFKEKLSSGKEAFEDADMEYLNEEIPEALEQSLEGIQRVAEIVLAMKEFSHPDNAEFVATDINRLIETTRTLSKNEWKYNAELSLELDQSLPMVECLTGEISQVILNLIVNASHAIGEKQEKTGDPAFGKIVISTAHTEDAVEIRISDTGGGIPKNIQEKIWEPFFTTKGIGKGTGQGLSIARATIVEKHSGTLRLETTEGTGTTFVIALPVSRK